MGLSAMTSSASICSVMRMMPSSAVSAEPARPVTMRAASTGPSSRISDNATAGPRNASDPKRESVKKICSPSTIPVKAPVNKMISSERKPMKLMRSTKAQNFSGGVTIAPRAASRKVPNRPSDATIEIPHPPSRSSGRRPAGIAGSPHLLRQETAHRSLHVLVARVDPDGAQPAQHRPRAVDVIDAPAAVPRPVVALRAANEVDGTVDGLQIARVAERAEQLQPAAREVLRGRIHQRAVVGEGDVVEVEAVVFGVERRPAAPPLLPPQAPAPPPPLGQPPPAGGPAAAL